MNSIVTNKLDLPLAFIIPPLVPGETEADFNDFCMRWFAEFKPNGMIECDWLQDIILGTWQRRRWERYRVALITSARRAAVQQIVFEYWDPDIDPDKSLERAIEFSRRWSAGDATARANFDALLKKNELDQQTIMARALTLVIEDLDRCDHLIAACLRRRDAAIAQLERRRSSLAERLKAANELADDVDYELIADGESR